MLVQIHMNNLTITLVLHCVLRPIRREVKGAHPSCQLSAASLPTAAGGVRGNAGREAEGGGGGERVSHAWRMIMCLNLTFWTSVCVCTCIQIDSRTYQLCGKNKQLIFFYKMSSEKHETVVVILFSILEPTNISTHTDDLS